MDFFREHLESRAKDLPVWSESQIDYRQWRDKRNEELAVYLDQRLWGSAEPDHEEVADALADASQGVSDELETQGFESQLQNIVAAPPTVHLPIIIPCVETSTTNHVKLLSDVNLFTNTLTLNLCRVERWWPLRSTRRFAKRTVSAYQQILHPGILERTELIPCTEDGPLSTLYKYVLSFEITQVNPAISSLRKMAPTARPPRRMLVFLYNAYAKQVSSIIRNAPQNSTIYLALENIPATSIFPFASNDWMDGDLNKVCVCVGGPSIMKNIVDDDEEYLRFDGNALKIRVGWLGEAFVEYLVKSTIEHGVTATKESDGPLRDEYNRAHPPQDKSPSAQETEQREPQPMNQEPPSPPRIGRSLLDEFDLNAQGTLVETTANVNENPSSNHPKPSTPRTLPSPSRKRLRHELHYYPLNDLKQVLAQHVEANILPDSKVEMCMVDVYALVLGFGSPSRTRSGDWSMAVALVDESLPLTNESGSVVDCLQTVELTIFAKFKKTLPQIRYAGDVLRMHRVKLSEWNGEIQLTGLRPSSYVVFRGDHESPSATQEWCMLPTAQNEFTLTDDDKVRFVQLWQWGQRRLCNHPTQKLSYMWRLSDIKRPTDIIEQTDDTGNGDLTVMVSAILTIPRTNSTSLTPRGFLRVWDGTGYPASDPFPIPTPDPSVNILNGDPPSEALVKIASIISRIRHIRKNDDIKAPKSLTGRVANVAVWEDSHWELVTEVVRVGSFIRLRNVKDQPMPDTGLRCLMVRSKSYLTPLPSMTYEVIKILEAHHERLLRNEAVNPQSGILPLEADSPYNVDRATEGLNARREDEAEDQEAPKGGKSEVTRMGLSAFQSDIVYSTFHGDVRIIGTIPPLDALESIGIENICPLCSNGKRIYRFALRLGDDSGSIDAILAENSDIGSNLLGMTPDAAIQNSVSAFANLKQCLEENTTRHCTIRSIPFNNAKYFLLESIEPPL